MENKALERIVEVNKGIEFNLSNSESYRGLYAQNILDKLRNLLEYLALFIYNDKNKINLDWDYENLQKSIKYISDKSQYNQKSESFKILEKVSVQEIVESNLYAKDFFEFLKSKTPN
ncbi:hypothetical protein [Helicobacter sp. UBA3407]|uniref:hypothetical protein n=1 Tax=Helicobacter TaxID=209 RepID=UPI0026026D90|nr:hypothetical protein [Helicobacter sp. UBA3407]